MIHRLDVDSTDRHWMDMELANVIRGEETTYGDL